MNSLKLLNLIALTVLICLTFLKTLNNRQNILKMNIPKSQCADLIKCFKNLQN